MGAEWVHRNPIQNPDLEDELPWVQEEDEGFYLQDEGGIPRVGPEEGEVYMQFEDRGEYQEEEEQGGVVIPEDEGLLPVDAPEEQEAAEIEWDET